MSKKKVRKIELLEITTLGLSKKAGIADFLVYSEGPGFEILQEFLTVDMSPLREIGGYQIYKNEYIEFDIPRLLK